MTSSIIFKYAKKRLNEQGTATTELAIAAPLLLLIVIAVFSLADAGQKKALLARAAMQGARLAVVKGSNHAAIADYIKKVMKTADSAVDDSRIKVTVENVNNVPLASFAIKPLKVTVSYDQPIISLFEWSPKIALSKSYTFEQWDNAVIFDIPAN